MIIAKKDITYRKYRPIKFCCNQLERMYDENYITIHPVDGRVNFINFKYLNDYHKSVNFDIKYCPFCGERIEVDNDSCYSEDRR